MTRKELLSVAKPILFNTEMVRAILDGRKTVTRRPVKGVPSFAWNAFKAAIETKGCYEHAHKNGKIIYTYPPYKVGDILYVRETWKRFCGMLYGWENGTYIPLGDFEGYQYKSDEQYIYTKGFNPLCDDFEDQKSDIHFDDNWHPSIHMPKEAARIFLRVTNVRVEQLQDITDERAMQEGFSSRTEFISEFLKMYPKCTVDSWVWGIEFEKVEVTE